MYECLICYENKEEHDKVKLTCSHILCQRCYQEIQKRSDCCPYCRTTFAVEDPDPEEWLYLDPTEWIVYSKVDNIYGTERIYVTRKNEDHTWRNNSIVIPLKRNRQRKKRLRNKNK